MFLCRRLNKIAIFDVMPDYAAHHNFIKQVTHLFFPLSQQEIVSTHIALRLAVGQQTAFYDTNSVDLIQADSFHFMSPDIPPNFLEAINEHQVGSQLRQSVSKDRSEEIPRLKDINLKLPVKRISNPIHSWLLHNQFCLFATSTYRRLAYRFPSKRTRKTPHSWSRFKGLQ